jgi:hypothetical protein
MRLVWIRPNGTSLSILIRLQRLEFYPAGLVLSIDRKGVVMELGVRESRLGDDPARVYTYPILVPISMGSDEDITRGAGVQFFHGSKGKRTCAF